MDNIIDFPGETYLDIPPEKVISNALEQDLEEVMIIGRRKDGSMFFSSSTGDLYRMLWAVETVKLEILDMGNN